MLERARVSSSRPQRGELGAEHRFALPGGEELNLAVGDLVRVNVYRSRRGEGHDLLNGFWAVVTAIDDTHSVEITWRDKKADPSRCGLRPRPSAPVSCPLATP